MLPGRVSNPGPLTYESGAGALPIALCSPASLRWMDDMRFYVLSTVFQSYQDDGSLIMKGCFQWNLSVRTDERIQRYIHERRDGPTGASLKCFNAPLPSSPPALPSRGGAA